MTPTTPTHRRARGRRPALSLLTATGLEIIGGSAPDGSKTCRPVGG